MILLFYNLALLSGLLASAPWWLWRMATTHKYREGLRERLGRVPPWLKSAAPKRPVIWLHAVSVGEVLAVSRLIAELDAALPGVQVLVSTTTKTGQDLARERFGPNRVFYCPLDLRWSVRNYLDALRPRLLILAETEFWPNLLDCSFRRAIPVAVVNARISDRSWPRYRKLRWLWRPLLSRIRRALAQSQTDGQRLTAIGCPPERVTVTGNLKFDVRAAAEAEATRLLHSLGSSMRFLVAGSTLEGEEAALIELWPALAAKISGLALVLAPRHPERFNAVAALLEKSKLAWCRRSGWTGRPLEEQRKIAAGQVILLDTIGELASVYSLATVAFVGGSIVPSGGHNPLEPAQFGVPIVMGPHYANFRAITDDLRAHDALRIASRNELAAVLVDLLAHPDQAEPMGRRAREVFDAQSGATDRTVTAIRALLAEGATS
ncbi:MAG TPA: 3-deoxy-D-manno-octulosonic acid transferase [Terracidiphilus sp.]|nr:3-deoxy-D-manno-octulosonic acid transferase [Terracidiphilus sp.]